MATHTRLSTGLRKGETPIAKHTSTTSSRALKDARHAVKVLKSITRVTPGAASRTSSTGLAKKTKPVASTPPAHNKPNTPTGANARQVGGSHYQGEIQCWDFVVSNNLGFLEGNVIKYVSRHHLKNGLQDLRKAQHYLEKLIEVINARNAARKGRRR